MRKSGWVAALAAGLMAVAVAVPAFAAVLTARLDATPTKGYYGQESVLTPSVDTTMVPGDKFEFQISHDGVNWGKYEDADQSIEDTGQVSPLYVVFDNSVRFPARFRAVFKTKASGNATQSISPVRTLYALKYLSTKTILLGSASGKAHTALNLTARVYPMSGEGRVTIHVYRRIGGTWKWLRKFNLTTDETGGATFSYTPAAAGAYRFRAQFAGNQFSVPSPVSWKSVTVR